MSDGEILLQLHAIEVEDHPGPLADPEQPLGERRPALVRGGRLRGCGGRRTGDGAPIVRVVHTNPNARQQAIWVRDPDGCLVVLAGPSEYRPR